MPIIKICPWTKYVHQTFQTEKSFINQDLCLWMEDHVSAGPVTSKGTNIPSALTVFARWYEFLNHSTIHSTWNTRTYGRCIFLTGKSRERDVVQFELSLLAFGQATHQWSNHQTEPWNRSSIQLINQSACEKMFGAAHLNYWVSVTSYIWLFISGNK